MLCSMIHDICNANNMYISKLSSHKMMVMLGSNEGKSKLLAHSSYELKLLSNLLSMCL